MATEAFPFDPTSENPAGNGTTFRAVIDLDMHTRQLRIVELDGGEHGTAKLVYEGDTWAAVDAVGDLFMDLPKHGLTLTAEFYPGVQPEEVPA